MKQLRKSCKTTAKEEPDSRTKTLEECNTMCLNDKNCLGIDFGKNDHEGECFISTDQSTDCETNTDFDAWIKSFGCGTLHNKLHSPLYQQCDNIEYSK